VAGVFVVSNTAAPFYLTADEVARDYLRTSRKAVYEMIRTGRLPGVTRVGRRVLVRRDRLVQFLAERESSVPSLGDSE
jgi:excisionase family DNA binding protein